jgi:hypothetical protein
MRTNIIAGYSIFLGISVLGMWAVILSTQEVPEGPAELTLHLIAEFLMALSALAAGIGILLKKRFGKGLCLAAHGMVVYSVLNAAGYYAQRGEYLLPLMFMLLLLASLWSISLLVLHKGPK